MSMSQSCCGLSGLCRMGKNIRHPGLSSPSKVVVVRINLGHLSSLQGLEHHPWPNTSCLPQLQLLLSGRWYSTIQSHTTRLKNSFFPQAVKLMNTAWSPHTHTLTGVCPTVTTRIATVCTFLYCILHFVALIDYKWFIYVLNVLMAQGVLS